MVLLLRSILTSNDGLGGFGAAWGVAAARQARASIVGGHICITRELTGEA